MSEVKFTPARPRADRNMILAAVLPVAQKIGMDAETIVEHYRHPMDGFDLALSLNRCALVDLARDDMEELDEIEWAVRRAVEEAEKKWADDNNIQPPHPVGTRIRLGVITGICNHRPAYYCVKENGCTQEGRSLLVRFEDALLPRGES